MASTKNLIDIYLERSRATDEDDELSRRSGEPLNSPPPGGPKVYGGTMPEALTPAALSIGPTLAVNRRASSRKVSPLNILTVLVGVAVVIVLYISNIIAIGQLLNQINQLQNRYDRILNEQEMLKAQISRMSSLERIRKIAEDELGLRNPAESPVWMELDPERIQEIQEQVQKTQQIQGKK
ncbi:MAG: septum formation initiator family protein [Bacteroidota bacterium]